GSAQPDQRLERLTWTCTPGRDRDLAPVESQRPARERPYRGEQRHGQAADTRGKEVRLEQKFSLWVGIDWATEEHEVCGVDANGKTVCEWKVAYAGASSSAMPSSSRCESSAARTTPCARSPSWQGRASWQRRASRSRASRPSSSWVSRASPVS